MPNPQFPNDLSGIHNSEDISIHHARIREVIDELAVVHHPVDDKVKDDDLIIISQLKTRPEHFIDNPLAYKPQYAVVSDNHLPSNLPMERTDTDVIHINPNDRIDLGSNLDTSDDFGSMAAFHPRIPGFKRPSRNAVVKQKQTKKNRKRSKTAKQSRKKNR